MKTDLSLLLVVVLLAGATLTTPAAAATSDESCPLAGPLPGAGKECEDLRTAFWAEIRTCMGRKQAEADARAGKPTTGNSHTNRARLFYCDAEARERLGLASN